MTFRWAWDWPALINFDRIPHPWTAAAVDAAVQRFTRERAPSAETGEYRLRVEGYVVGLFVNRAAETVLVTYIYRCT